MAFTSLYTLSDKNTINKDQIKTSTYVPAYNLPADAPAQRQASHHRSGSSRTDRKGTAEAGTEPCPDLAYPSYDEAFEAVTLDGGLVEGC